MAHSVVKVIETDLAESLTLIVGEDGIITPDKETTLSILGNRPTTDLNILYMNKTAGNKLDVTLDSLMYINSDEIEDADYNMDEVSRNLRNLKLDHDYTSLKSPIRQPAEDDVDLEDELAQTLRVLHGHLPDDEVEQRLFQINKQKEKDAFIKKVASQAVSIKVAKIINTNQKLAKISQKAAEIAEHTSQPKLGTEETEEMEEEEEIERSSIDEDESDDENDSDFTLDEEKPKQQSKRILNKRPILLDKIIATTKIVKVKPIVKTPKLPGGKQPPKTPIAAEKPTNKEPETAEVDPPIEQNNKPPLESISRVVEKKPQPPKKEKKVPKPILDDFALFSTPDIIRRVGAGKDAVAPTPDAPPTNQISSPKPAKISPENRSRTTSIDSKSIINAANPNKLSSQKRHSSDAKQSRDTSILGVTSTPRRPSVEKQARMEDSTHVSVQEFETNSSSESITGEKVGGALEPLPSAEDIRAIIQSDSIKTFTTYSDTVAPVAEISAGQQQTATIDPVTVSPLDHIDQTLLLDNISPDLITDDILYQVAQSLVDNTVLQNAIDKMEVDPAVVGDFIGTQNPTVAENNNMDLQPIASAQQIVRPDGRVITLPPVERPTTRSRNRRGPISTNSSPATPAPSSVNTSSLNSPATSVVTTPTSAVRPIKTPLKPLDDDHVSGNELDSSDDDDDGDEEDPNKLWCICNQPHNNRFMICCDTCEEWYHGKCVNVTKAMGQAMEAEGKEWMCLYCKDGSLRRPKAAARRIRKASRTSSESASKSSTSTLSMPSGTNRTVTGGKVIKQQKQPQQSSSGAKTSGGCLICGKPTSNNKLFCSDECILKHAANVEKKVIVYDRKTHKLLSGTNAPTAANLDRWLKEHPSYEVVRTNKIANPQQQLQQQQQQQQQQKRSLPGGPLTQSKLKLVRNDATTPGGVSLALQRKGVNIGMSKHTPPAGVQQQSLGIPKLVRKFPPGMKVIQRQPVASSNPNQLSVTPKSVKLIPATNLPQYIASSQQGKQSLITKGKNVIQAKLNIFSGTFQSAEKKRATINVNTFIRDKAPGSGKDRKPIPTKTPTSRQAEGAATTSTTAAQKQENIREGIRKSLLEQLQNRLRLIEDLELTDDELSNISEEIESQLYKCFGDTGQKYRNKYRSLIFNIKDLKNQTLWRKICENAINPYQLVRLSSDDLASQELAMWRERETKHQLDMIKKSELELMNCTRQYVFKTHKGEQVFEDDKPKENLTDVISDFVGDNMLDSREKDGDKSAKDRDNKKSTSSKSSRRDRDRSKDRGRDRDRKYNKDRTDSKERRRDSNDRSRKKRSRSRDRSDRDNKRSRSRDRDKDRRSGHKSSRHKKDLDSNKLDKKSTELLEQLVDKHILKPFEDKLWKHVSQDDLLPNVSLESDSDHEPTSTVTIPTPPRSTDPEEADKSTTTTNTTVNNTTSNPQTSDSSDKFDIPATPSPTISPKPPSKPLLAAVVPSSASSNASSSPGTAATGQDPLWRGTINMVDVAEISITAHEVSGDCSGLRAELPPALDIVGRISPDTVWDYIGNIKSSHSKVISLLRLNATNVEEKMPYIALYSYLSSRNRLGVVKVMNKVVKDFYILPLASHRPIPQALLPLNGPGFEESRPHLLLGIVIRHKRKRPAIDTHSTSLSSTPTIKRVKVDVIITGSPKDKAAADKDKDRSLATSGGARSYTPPPTGARDRDPRKIRVTARTVNNAIAAEKMDVGDMGGVKDEENVMMVVEEEEDHKVDHNEAMEVEEMKKGAEDDADGDEEGDDDEPYSPEDSDPDSLIVPIDTSRLNSNDISSLLTGSVKASSFIESGLSTSQTFEPFTSKFDSIPGLDGGTSIPASTFELQRKMAELDQKIAMQKAEIDNMSHNIATTATTDIGTSVLANIALPSDLQQILENIKTIGGAALKDAASKTPDRKISPIHNPKWSPPDSLSTKAASSSSSSELTMPLILPRLSSRNQSSPKSATSIPLNLPKMKPKPQMPSLQPAPSYETTSSVLSSLTEEDLIRKAAEMLGEAQKVAITTSAPPKLKKMKLDMPLSANLNLPPPPLPVPAPIRYVPTSGYQTMTAVPPMPKKTPVEMAQPPIPGLEDELL